ncbi:hypothetical protein [cyanobacterium endosymbiont of Epithemia clementina EcSB]|uniref:hypothetical protein n=1 Tax=cyanobacterium endosymbiont of Epithemia clementina EcSB TaxID=3034674 RepID=UPI00248027F6|nr:hypothetical protein [cyanobacterium endosymbiont of Epithemia clementina EcSB]WGT68316.1 hypothetical protein P3F56_04485 [cyanobacterium endosymbiont of Epithemia clementina EcSB]
MNFKEVNLYSLSNRLIFIALVLVYFILGIYLISQTSITSDEPAYIGAAYAYTQGLGLNQEHPLFFKLVTSLIINLFFSDYQIVVPPINVISGEENREVRLAAFNLGYSFLLEHPENFKKIIFILRFCYLFINSIFLLWVYFFTFCLPQIPTYVSIFFTILYVFSPSFYSHNFLISFDVPVSIYALSSLWTTIIIIRQLELFRKSELITCFIVLNFVFFLAINAKFSNLILVPIILSAYSISLIYLLKKNLNILAIKFSVLGFISLLIQPILIIFMYCYAFRNLPNQSIIHNIQRYIQGIQMNLSTAGGIREPFVYENFVNITSLEYLNKIFWFKENPALFIVTISIIIIIFKKILIERIYAKNWLQKLIILRKNRWQLYLCCLGASYPLIYLSLTYKSRFIIGYRYFYPLIIFIYFGIAYLTFLLKKKWQKYFLIGSFSLYIYFGLLGIPQSLSYVNPLWTPEKWRLADDSTINWGQETQHAVKYLLNNHLLPEKNVDIIVYKTFGVNINFVQYLYLLSQEKNYAIDIQSYYSYDNFNPETIDIAQLNVKYLLIDSTVKQQIISQALHNSLAAKNWRFLANHIPIYSRNDIIFIYQLK